MLDEHRVDLFLGHLDVARGFADRDAHRVGGSQLEQNRVRQSVVDHYFGSGQYLSPATGEQARVAGAGADQPDGHASTPAN